MARFVGISPTRFPRVFSYTCGAKTDRAVLAKVIGRLEPDDVVTRLDRLARSTRKLLNVIDAVTKRGPASVR
jgi:DNA invertase Pin-like site-specific DNA recombinase